MSEIEISEDGYINMLNNQNGGAVVDELNRELSKGVGAVLDHGGASTITLKISLSRIAGMEKTISISHDVTVKHPKEDRPRSAMFVSNGNGLLTQPQEQLSMPLKQQIEPVESKLDEATGNVTHLK